MLTRQHSPMLLKAASGLLQTFLLLVLAFMSCCQNPCLLQLGNVKSDEENKKNSVKCLFRNNCDEGRGSDILIRGFWVRGMDCIINVQIAGVDGKSNRSEDPAKVLAAHEREKKKKLVEACLEQRPRCFSPFVVHAWMVSSAKRNP